MASSSAPRNPILRLLTGEHRLTVQILIAIILAFAFALTLPHAAAKVHVGGEVFLNLLKMMVVPLVVTSVMSGIFGMGDVRKLGKPGGFAVLYYLSTTFLAVIVGLVVVNLIQPGVGSFSDEKLAELTAEAGAGDETRAALATELSELTGRSPDDIAEVMPFLETANGDQGIGVILENLVLMLFTDNLLESAANTDLLPLIVFAIVFAAILSTMGSRVSGLVSLVGQLNDALMKLILLFMKIAPLGIFCLVAARFGEAQADGELARELSQIGQYFGTVLAGLAVHLFGTLPLILWLTTRRNPYRFMFNMLRALLTAFSTASSSATLPITMETAIDKAGVSERSTEFVLPLGATINMDGTALYEAVAAIFIAQVAVAQVGAFGFADQVVVAITATLAAIGAAGIPEAGLVTMIIVLNAVGLPVEYMGLILSVDWLLDRFRTAVNVFGDAVGAAVVERHFEDPTLLASGDG